MARNGDEHVDAPANVDIEAVVWSDPRFRMLATRTGVDLFSAICRCARVWSACTDRSTCLMSEEDVDLFAELPGFGAAMVASRLAAHEEDGLYISGTQGRIEWLQDLRVRAGNGGRASAKARKERRGNAQPGAQPAAQAPGTPRAQPPAQAHGHPGAQANSNQTRTPVPDPGPDPGSDSEKSMAAAPPAPLKLGIQEPKKPSDHAQFTAAFDALFRERTGSGATWGKAQGGMVADLLKKHGLAESLKRAERLFKSPPSWLAKDGEVPTLQTLVGNFDALAVAITPAPMSPPPRSNGFSPQAERERALHAELAANDRAAREMNLVDENGNPT